MKKYLLIAFAVALIASPVMANPTLSGTFRLGAIWDIAEENYLARFDRARLVFRSDVDDYNSIRFEVRGERNRVGIDAGPGSVQSGRRARGNGTSTIEGLDSDGNWGDATLSNNSLGNFGDTTNPGSGMNFLYVHTATVTTNWARYFDFEDAVGLTTTIGYGGFGTFDRLSYTIWGVGGQQWATAHDFGGRIAFDIMGIVKPYAATTFAAYNAGPSFVAGVGVDLASVVEPVDIWLELFFIQDGVHSDEADVNSTANPLPTPSDVFSRGFGVELQVAMDVADDMRARLGAVLDVRNKKRWMSGAGDGFFYPARTIAPTTGTPPQVRDPGGDDFATLFKVLADFSAYGATLGVAFMGGVPDEDNGFFPLGKLGVSLRYDITRFLAVQAGAKFAFGDFAKYFASDENWLGAEFGVVVRPGSRVRYDIGYLVLNQDAVLTHSALLSPGGTIPTGGNNPRAHAYTSDTWGLGNTAPTGNGSWGRLNQNWSGGLMFTVNASF